MGFFDNLKTEARRNFIARPDEAKSWIIWKYPERNVRMMTQLTVGADEQALFFKDGKVVGKLGDGKHSLDTNNVPFISSLLEKVTGGDLFVAEIYFVSTHEISGVKFGGPIGDVRDPETGLGIGTMVYGDFSFKVMDPEKLVVGLVGLGRSGNDEFVNWFKNQVLKVTRDRIAELIVKKAWPLLNVTSGAYTEEIEEEVVAGLVKHLDGYGVKVKALGNFHVSIKEEDEATLKKLSKDVAYSKLAGGYGQYAQAQAVMGAGEGMAKGGGGSGAALEGMGLGVGFGMAQMFAGQMGGQRPGGPAPAAGGPAVPVSAGPSGGGDAPAAAGKTVVERLKDINELHKAGVLSDDEYNAKKAELMKLL